MKGEGEGDKGREGEREERGRGIKCREKRGSKIRGQRQGEE